MREKWEPAGVPPGKYGIAWKEYSIGKYKVFGAWLYRLWRNGICLGEGDAAEPLKLLARNHRREQ